MRYLIVSILTIIIIFLGFSSSRKNSTNILKITQDDEKVILEYLDTKTDDIAYSTKGKMFSAFKLLGTDKNKIYIWVAKVEYINTNIEGKITYEEGESVILPMVLNIKKSNDSFSIINHDAPEDGKNYGKSFKKLFPSYIKCPNNDELLQLKKITKKRAEINFEVSK